MSEADEIPEFYWRVNELVDGGVQAIPDSEGRVDYADANDAFAFAREGIAQHPGAFVSFYQRVMQDDCYLSQWRMDLDVTGKLIEGGV